MASARRCKAATPRLEPTAVPRPPSPQLLDRLQALLGDKGFSDDADAMAPWLTDWRGKYHGRAAAMLSPATTGEVAAVVRLCAQEDAALDRKSTRLNSSH